MGVKLDTSSVDLSADSEQKNAPQNPLVPVAGGEPVPAGGVILALCKRAATDATPHPPLTLCRQSSAGAFKSTGRADDIARAFAAGLLSID